MAKNSSMRRHASAEAAGLGRMPTRNSGRSARVLLHVIDRTRSCHGPVEPAGPHPAGYRPSPIAGDNRAASAKPGQNDMTADRS